MRDRRNTGASSHWPDGAVCGRTHVVAGRQRTMALTAPLVAMVALGGCISVAGLGSLHTAEGLSVGMTPAEARTLMGAPAELQTHDHRTVWKYRIFDPQQGWMPCYLVFSDSTNRLVAWYADYEELARSQQIFGQTLQGMANLGR